MSAKAYFGADANSLATYRPGAREPEPVRQPVAEAPRVARPKPKPTVAAPPEREIWFLMLDRRARFVSCAHYGLPSQCDERGVVIPCVDEVDANRRRGNLCAEFAALASREERHPHGAW